MDTFIEWLGKYSPGVVALLAFAAGMLYVVKLSAEKAIEHGFERHAKEVELALARRSAFLEKVLTERWTTVTALVASLQRILTNLNRMRMGEASPDGFLSPKGDLVPLTTVFEDLEIHRLVIGEALHAVLHARAKLALDFANARAEAQSAATIEALEE
ncbi:MAG TPA: hypothetical protein VF705_01130, partial [Longimicrobium sp.]